MERAPPDAPFAEAVAETERSEGGEKPERHRDRPRQGEAEARMRRPAREDDHRSERSTRREDGVFERTEPEHPDAGLPRIEACVLERVPVDEESAANDEDAEAGRDDRARATDPETWAALDARNFAIRDDVAQVSRDFHPEGDGKPDRVDVVQVVQDLMEAGRPGDAHDRAECQRSADADQQQVLAGIALEMRQGSKKAPELHPSIGSVAGLRATTPGGLHPVVAPVAPDPPHGEAGAAHDPDEAELLVSAPPVPEVQADRGDDEQSRPVEDDHLPGRPRRDLVPALAPDEVDEERDCEEERDPEHHPDRDHGGIEVEQHDPQSDQADDQEASERRAVGKELAHKRRLAANPERGEREVQL